MNRWILVLVALAVCAVGYASTPQSFGVPGTDESIGSLPDKTVATSNPDFSGTKLEWGKDGFATGYWLVHHSLDGHLNLLSALQADIDPSEKGDQVAENSWKYKGTTMTVKTFRRIDQWGHIEDERVWRARHKLAFDAFIEIFPPDHEGEEVGLLLPFPADASSSLAA